MHIILQLLYSDKKNIISEISHKNFNGLLVQNECDE